MGSLNKSVLVLNKVWFPIRVIDVKRALKLVFSEKAFLIHPEDYSVVKWEEWVSLPTDEDDSKCILTTSGKIKIPEVIALSKYDKVNNRKAKLTKRNIMIRDNFTCQYTGKKLKKSECDIDHIIPKSKGGKNSWDNMVVCSKEINRKKGDKFIDEMGLSLVRKPYAPSVKNLILNPDMPMPKSWKNFIEGM